MKYIAEGATITNRLLFLDGRVKEDIMGGGGFYAYSALRMCTEDCLFVSSVGKDFDDFYGAWFDANHCSKDGLFVRLEKTMYNDLKYFPDGSYIEYSIYEKKYTDEELSDLRKQGIMYLGAEDPDEARRQYLTTEDILPFMDEAKGLYTSQVLTDENDELLLAHKKGGCKIMWEIPATSLEEAHERYIKGGIEGLKHYLRAIDILSINRNECMLIFEKENAEEILPLLKQLELPVYYRVGTDGAYMIDDYKDYFVPMISTVPKEEEIDPTGCGNSSTGAVLWAWCEGYDPLMTCVIGNVVASYNVRQYGPYLDMSENRRKEMMKIAEEICEKLKKERNDG
ncbi:MAG: carbohydrate kinase family protein [Erysipelotrichaceae bacterium]|nr:carbohydrate kinase family protein [Erysipelotrichaceae bacterium]